MKGRESQTKRFNFDYIRNEFFTMKKLLFSLILPLVLIKCIQAQVNPKDSVVFAPLINVHYSYQIPGGDLSRRFGNNNSLGASFMIKDRKNWLYGIEGSFLFGSDVNEDPIAQYRVENNEVISEKGTYAYIAMMERGFYFKGNFGKIIPILGPNKNSGPMIMVGVGFIQHSIRYQVDRNTVPWLNDDYEKGYDRLTNGLLLSQFIGYRYFGNKRFLNFYIGYEFFQGFTKSRRSYNFDTQESDDENRQDLLQGVKVGWTIPLYKKTPREFYYD